MGVILEADHVIKRYPPIEEGLGGWRTMLARVRGVAETVSALEDLTFAVQEGEIFGLLGPNGAGKTTLCKILNALVIPTSGAVRAFGMDSVREHRAIARDMVTIFGGESDLFGLFEPRLSCEHNLRFIGDLWGLDREATMGRMDEAIELLELRGHRREWFQKLSGGTKQKLFLAAPFILRRRLVVLDEPTIRLDVPTRRRVHEVLREELNRRLGTTILLTTHDMQEAERLCDRVGILVEGRLRCVDTPEGLRRRARSGPTVRLRLRGEPELLAAELRRALSALDPPPGLQAEEDRTLEEGLCAFRVCTTRGGADEGVMIRSILGAVDQAGLTPVELSVERPSFEDVFVDILGESRS